MGFGSFSSESRSSDNRIGAGDNSNIIRGKGRITEAGGLSVSDKAAYLTGGSISLAKGSELHAGLEIGKADKIVINDTTGIETLTGKLNDTIKGLQQQNSALANEALNRVSNLSQSSQTGGTASQPVLYIMLGLLALVGFIFFIRR